jgi:NitT/TauT family transport system permease protein
MVSAAGGASDQPFVVGRAGSMGRAARTRILIARWARVNWLSIVSCVAVLILWEVGARIIDYPYLPPISEIASAFWEILANGTVAKALGTSLKALAYGISLAVILGILLGALMGLSTTARYALNIYVDAIMSAPMTAFVPLFVLLFGLGIETRVIVVTLFAFFPIVVNTQAGMLAADPELIQMARSFGASPMKIFFRVRLPMSYEHIQAGLRMGMARGVDGNVTGEVLIAAVGLGGLVTQYGRAYTTDKLFAVVVVIVILSFTAVTLTRWAGRFALGMRR